MKFSAIPVLCLVAALSAGLAAQAQTIDRVKLTDNDMNCQAIYGEISQMDAVLQRASQPAPQAAAPAAAEGGGSMGGQLAGAVAQQALANTAARGGLFGGGGGLFGGGGGIGGLFGSLAGAAVQNNAAQQAATQGAAQQAAAPQAPQNQALMQQAQGRKDHLTSLFLGKGCKMSDILK